LIESCGFSKEKDLFSFIIDGEYQLPEWMESLADRLARKKGVHIRAFRLKDPVPELALIREIFNDCWSDNWGYVPLSDHEIREIGKSMVAIADQDLAFFIYYEDEPVGVCVVLPDINPLLKRLNGSIGLSGALNFSSIGGRLPDCGDCSSGSRRSIGSWGFPCWPSATSMKLCAKKENIAPWSWVGPWRITSRSTLCWRKPVHEYTKNIAYTEKHYDD
jgi:hypothetical protein